MKNGLLITNGFVGEQSFIKLWNSLLAAAENRGMSLMPMPHDKLLFDAASGIPLWDADGVDFTILWDKDVRLGYQLERLGIRVFNPPAAIEICDDKSLTHIALAGRLPMPPTVIIPT
ncbi:MAG: RimK family alpha-L-glutamate ligase, partial [Clostridia bacterium]|nr:RimK family alpha-L-glutamate ligase [Clostridia bacterium]